MLIMAARCVAQGWSKLFKLVLLLTNPIAAADRPRQRHRVASGQYCA
jgi:hypothetical protein